MPTSFNRLEILRQHIAIPLKAFEADGTEHVLNGLTFAQGSGAKTLYIPSDPSQNTGVHITHDAADTPLVVTMRSTPARVILVVAIRAADCCPRGFPRLDDLPGQQESPNRKGIFPTRIGGTNRETADMFSFSCYCSLPFDNPNRPHLAWPMRKCQQTRCPSAIRVGSLGLKQSLILCSGSDETPDVLNLPEPRALARAAQQNPTDIR